MSKVQKFKLTDDKENHLVYEYNIILHDNDVIDDDGYSCSAVVVMMKESPGWLELHHLSFPIFVQHPHFRSPD